MGGVHGVENTGKILDLLAEGGNVAEKMAKQDGGVVKKLGHLASLVDEMWALTSLKPAELMAELKELDAEDKAALNARLQGKFDLADDKVEALVEEGIMLAEAHGENIAKTIAWVQKIRDAAKPAVAPAPQA